ncbi:helix-turn-helix domain-containing protein [Weeksella sp. HMSC059D05]|uniref:helix-turn-helix domain-containing protein n=1 Tax=Weeksella sp. HMSC059D05 TaxID=1715139 RepID=UPI00143B3CE2|nr:helix-turn-helix domain-containing protein [Weeksella sp. HMSC059D05]
MQRKINQVLDIICREYQVDKQEIQSRARTEDVAKARQSFFYICQKMLKAPLELMAEVVPRDHATILYSINIYDKEKDKNPFHSLMYKSIKEIIENEVMTTTTEKLEESKFRIGDKVYKPKGYKFPGEVRAIFTNTRNEIRIVAEMEDNGMLHIFNESQLKILKTK